MENVDVEITSFFRGKYSTFFNNDVKDKISWLRESLKFQRFLGMTLKIKYHVSEKP